MTAVMTAGKKRGLQAVADKRGVIAALAIDQRSALRKLFGKAMNLGAEDVPTEKLVQYKEAVSKSLTLYASAILLDPEYGLTAARKQGTEMWSLAGLREDRLRHPCSRANA